MHNWPHVKWIKNLLGSCIVLIPALLTEPICAQAITAAGEDAADVSAFGVTASYDKSTGIAASEPVLPASTAVPMISAIDRARSIDCMSRAIAYEAANQPIAGQEAVGEVIVNRLRDPQRPKTVCGVVFQGAKRRTGCQFTFACDGSMQRHLSPQTMLTARNVASAVLDGAAPNRIGNATHYHANYVSPAWAAAGRKVAQIGAHIFYEMPSGAWHAPISATTIGEPAIAVQSILDMQVPHRDVQGRRRARLTALMSLPAAPAVSQSLFRPWGLSISGR